MAYDAIVRCRIKTSGYCACACRDCFDIAISSVGDIVGTVLCNECKDAGCEPLESDCQRDLDCSDERQAHDEETEDRKR